MGGESNSSRLVSAVEASMGSETELIRIGGAQLYLIDGEESVLMQTGDFALLMLKQAHSFLAAIVARVGEVQWPVGKDAPVLKVWNCRYTFALPGLVYGLILPENTSIEVLQQLEALILQYCTFEVHQEIAEAQQQIDEIASEPRDAAGYWTAVAPDVEGLSSTIARQICSTSRIVANSIVMGSEWVTLGIQHGGSFVKRQAGPEKVDAGTGVSPRMMRRMQQARRMSAVAKLVSKTLLKGAISASGHVASKLGLDVNSAPGSPTYSPNTGVRKLAVASVDAFAKVVEAIETAGKSPLGASSRVGTDLVHQKFGHQAGEVVENTFGAVGNVINTAWTLNKMGLRMLLQVTAASTALNIAHRGDAKPSSSEESQPSSSPSSSSQMSQSSALFHQITLSPPQQQDPMNVIVAVPVQRPPLLQTSELFPTTAGPIRTETLLGPAAQAPVSSYLPSGDYTTSIPPGPRPNSPFQQYPRHGHQYPPYNFPYGVDQSRTSS